MKIYYFAYGSNMYQEQMKERCPNSQFIKRAYLEGYKFIYDGYSSKWRGAVANIVEEEGNIVWGALYEITEEDLKKLDKYEGFPQVYQRCKILVKDDLGREYKAWVYLRDPQEKNKPSEEYRNRLYEGAKQCDLPYEYVKKYILQRDLEL